MNACVGIKQKVRVSKNIYVLCHIRLFLLVPNMYLNGLSLDNKYCISTISYYFIIQIIVMISCTFYMAYCYKHS